MPTVSVIIPVYNAYPYLDVCLGSLIRQTLNDIEIICIDDGSTDGSLALLQEYAEHDPRIRVIASGVRRGASAARNAGLAAAKGEFIGFVDADDYVDPHYYGNLHAAAASTGADIVKGSLHKEDEAGRQAQRQAEEEYNRNIDENAYVFSINFTTAIYRRSMLANNAVVFPEGITNYEDVVFLVQAVYYANTVKTVCDTYYYCTSVNENSTSRRPFDALIAYNVFLSCEKIIGFINTVAIENEYYNHIFYQIIQTILYSMHRLPDITDALALSATTMVRSHKFLGRPSQNHASIPETRRSSLDVWQRLRNWPHLRGAQKKDNASAVAAYYRDCTKMTVCLFTGSLAAGGAERQLVTLARGLASAGVNVYVLCQNLGGARNHYRPLLQEAGIPVLGIANAEEGKEFLAFGATVAKKETSLVHNVRSLPLSYVNVLCLTGILAKLSPDILHCYLDRPNCAGGCAGAIAGVPGIVLSFRSLNPATYSMKLAAWTRPVYTFLLPRDNIVMEANSSAGAADYAQWLDIPEHAVRVNHNGVTPATCTATGANARHRLRRDLGLDKHTPVTLYISRDISYKRPDDMLDIAIRLRSAKPDAHILAVGQDLDDSGEMAAKVRSRGLADVVRLLGVRTDIPALLAAADVLLLTSEIEGFPNAIMEAMSAGLPVVATCVGGVPDLVRPGEDGFLHPVGDIAGMAGSLARLLADPALRARMGENGKRRIKQNFTVDKLVDRTMKQYAALLGNAAFPKISIN